MLSPSLRRPPPPLLASVRSQRRMERRLRPELPVLQHPLRRRHHVLHLRRLHDAQHQLLGQRHRRHQHHPNAAAQGAPCAKRFDYTINRLENVKLLCTITREMGLSIKLSSFLNKNCTVQQTSCIKRLAVDSNVLKTVFLF